MNKNFKTALLVIFSFIVGGLVTFSLLKWSPLLKDVSNTTTITKNGTKVAEKSSLSSSIDKIYDAVVLVQAYTNDTVSSTGTGFVYKVDEKYGYILTNQHVIAKEDKIVLTFSNDEEVEGTLLGSDEYLDLAVIRIDKSKVLAVAELGSSEKSNIGDQVFTVGSPLGKEYRGSVTSGILSGKNRMVTVSVKNVSSGDWVMKVLQTDAAVNPGNSGGPLVNINGEVIGIISMKLSDEDIEGMGFAIPIEFVKSHTESLEKKEEIEWPVMGINMVNINDTMGLYRNDIEVDKNIKYGVVVVKVVDKTGASASGLKSGDVIVAIDKQKVENTAYLRYELFKHKVGEEIEVTYIRDGKEATTKVKLSKS